MSRAGTGDEKEVEGEVEESEEEQRGKQEFLLWS